MVAPQIGVGLGEFERAHPDVCAMTDAMADEVVSIVRRGEAELGVGPERATGDDVTSTFPHGRADPAGLPGAASAGDATGRLVEKLRDARWVIYSSEFNRHLERLLHAHDGLLSMQTAVEVKCLATALALMGVGAGLAAVPDYGRIFAPNFNVHFIKLRAPEIRRRYSIYQRRGRVLSPPAEASSSCCAHARHAAMDESVKAICKCWTVSHPRNESADIRMDRNLRRAACPRGARSRVRAIAGPCLDCAFGL